MSVLDVLTLLGGIGMFLYGMSLLGDSLRNLTGNKMERLLAKLTSSKLRGTLLGTLITGIVQSSAATSIIVLGFVNAGIMSLSQGIPVVFGANIGSTVTGQILRLGDISSDSMLLTLLKPSSFAPAIIAVGAFMLLFSKSNRANTIAKILVGFGILFFGMTIMEGVMSATLRGNPQFEAFFTNFTNPFWGIMIGILLTAAIQSSSASVGILQALSATGVVSFRIAVPIIFGQNIGKSATVWLGSVGTNKKAKRVALIHTAFNVIGVAVLGALLYGADALFHFSFWDTVLNRGAVADLHSAFNILTTLMVLPFTEKLIELSGKVFQEREEDDINGKLRMLDDIFIKNPPIALEQCRKVLILMEETIQRNFQIANQLRSRYDNKTWLELQDNERFLDNAENAVNSYLVKITALSLSPAETRTVTEMMHIVGDLERIGDYCEKIAKVADYNNSNGIAFSPGGLKELASITAAVENILNMTFTAYDKSSLTLARRVTPLANVIDTLRELLKSRHVQRLQNSRCSLQAGLSFVELLTDFDRISDHCTNIAEHIIQKHTGRMAYDAHQRIDALDSSSRMEYRALIAMYEATYCAQYREKEEEPENPLED